MGVAEGPVLGSFPELQEQQALECLGKESIGIICEFRISLASYEDGLGSGLGFGNGKREKAWMEEIGVRINSVWRGIWEVGVRERQLLVSVSV